MMKAWAEGCSLRVRIKFDHTKPVQRGRVIKLRKENHYE